MHLRDALPLLESIGKEGQKGLDPLISEVRVYRVPVLKGENVAKI